MKRNKSPQRSLGFSCFSSFIVVVLHIIHETSLIRCCLMSNIKGQCSLSCISTPAIETTQGICIPQGSIIEIWNQQIAWWIRTAICLEGCLFLGGDFGKISGWITRLFVCLSKTVSGINLRLSYMLKQKTWGIPNVLLLPTRTAPSRFATSGCHSFNGHFWLKRRRMLGALYPQHFVSGNMNDLNKRWFEVGSMK